MSSASPRVLPIFQGYLLPFEEFLVLAAAWPPPHTSWPSQGNPAGDNYRTMDFKPSGNCWAGSAGHASIKALRCSASKGNMETKGEEQRWAQGKLSHLCKRRECSKLSDGFLREMQYLSSSEFTHWECAAVRKGHTFTACMWEFQSCGSLKAISELLLYTYCKYLVIFFLGQKPCSQL